MNSDDAKWMQVAIDLAAKGRGHVEPNPMVGCVVVADDQQIGAGYHERFGSLHAERNALATVGQPERLTGATAYVTLEPCCHHGKTPPCTEAILAAKIPRVVVAMLDPFDQVAGQGVAELRAAGVDVQVGVLEADAKRLCQAYIKRVTKQLPWVIGKWAMSLDGKIATRSGDSQWISGPESRQVVHEIRSQVDAVVVGSRTALLDDPQLTARIDGSLPRSAIRVVVDSSAKLSPESRLVQTASDQPVVVWAGPEASADRVEVLSQSGVQVCISNSADPNARLMHLLHYLAAEKSATNVLCEGGGQLLGSLLEIGQLDQCEIFVGPRIIGGEAAASPIAGLGFESLADSPAVDIRSIQTRGDDVHISCLLG